MSGTSPHATCYRVAALLFPKKFTAGGFGKGVEPIHLRPG